MHLKTICLRYFPLGYQSWRFRSYSDEISLVRCSKQTWWDYKLDFIFHSGNILHSFQLGSLCFYTAISVFAASVIQFVELGTEWELAAGVGSTGKHFCMTFERSLGFWQLWMPLHISILGILIQMYTMNVAQSIMKHRCHTDTLIRKAEIAKLLLSLSGKGHSPAVRPSLKCRWLQIQSLASPVKGMRWSKALCLRPRRGTLNQSKQN